MQIKCPECSFTREINEDAIPASSSFATCPKCRTRFRFRADPLVEPENSQSVDQTLEHPAQDNEPAEDIWASMDKMRDDWEEIDRSEEHDGKPQSGYSQRDPADDAGRREEAQRAYQQAASRGDKVPLYTTLGSVPWEYKGGFLNPVIFFRTVVMIISRIPQFFGGINPFSSILPSWVFLMVVRCAELLAVMYGTRLNVAMEDGSQQVLSLVQIFQVPIPMLLAFAIFIFSVIQFGGSLIVFYATRMHSPDKANFRLTFKVMAYASMPSLFSLIPGIGVMLSFMGSIALLILGIRHAYRLNWQQTAVSLAPYFLIGLVLWGMSMQMSVSMMQG